MTLASIRKILKRSFDKINNERLKHNILQAIPFWIASLVAGLLAVAYSKAFSYLESTSFSILEFHGWEIFILTPVCFLLAWWLVVRYGPYARTSGIPQVRAAIELDTTHYGKKIKKLLSLKILVVKVVSGLFMILGGGAVGKEGPVIQLSGIVFKKFNDWLPSWWPPISKRNMITAGAAAGLAAAFNTPLGGIVFAIEELTKTHFSYFRTALFTAVIIAGLTAQGILGPYLYLGYPQVSPNGITQFFVIGFIAVIAGLAAAFMSASILWIRRQKKGFGFAQNMLFAFFSGLVIALIGLYLGDSIFGSGKELMNHFLFSADKGSHINTPILRLVGPILTF